MLKKVFYSLYEAECAAMGFVMDHPGARIDRHSGGSYRYRVITHHDDPDEDDHFHRNVDLWSGEIPAICVLDKNDDTIALFGWWTDEFD